MAKVASAKGSNGHAPTNRIKDQVVRVTIQPLNTQRIPFKLRGISPLVMHNFDSKSRQEMLDKQTGKTKKTAREHRCPEMEFLESLYWVKGCPPSGKVVDGILKLTPEEGAKAIAKAVFGFPLAAFKQAMVSACRNADIPMTVAKQSFFVSGKSDPNFAIINGVPQMDNRIVRLKKGGTPMERFRGMFEQWSTEIVVDFDRNNFSPDQIANLLNIAGYYVGIGEGRPEKCALGWGRFEII